MKLNLTRAILFSSLAFASSQALSADTEYYFRLGAFSSSSSAPETPQIPEIPEIPETPEAAKLIFSQAALSGLDYILPAASVVTDFVEVTNTGGSLSSIPLQTLTGPFRIVASTCTAALAPNDKCLVRVAAEASPEGSGYDGTLSFEGTAEKVALSGKARCRSTTTPCKDGSFHLGEEDGRFVNVYLQPGTVGPEYYASTYKFRDRANGCDVGDEPLSAGIANKYLATTYRMLNSRGYTYGTYFWLNTSYIPAGSINAHYYYVGHSLNSDRIYADYRPEVLYGVLCAKYES